MVKTAIVSSKELGSNCWLPARFVKGARCDRVMQCTYPEKKTCKALNAEIAYLQQERRKEEEQYHTKISKLIAEQQGG